MFSDAAKSQFMSKIRLQINRATETAIHRAGSTRIVHIGRPGRGFEEGPTTNSAASPAIASV
jgi:hypothetical protein